MNIVSAVMKKLPIVNSLFQTRTKCVGLFQGLNLWNAFCSTCSWAEARRLPRQSCGPLLTSFINRKSRLID